MEKSKKETFLDYIYIFPVGAKRSRSVVIKQNFAEREVLRLKGNKDLRCFVSALG